MTGRATHVSRAWGFTLAGRFARRGPSSRQRAVTLTEVMVAASVGLIVSVALVGFLDLMAKMSKSVLSQLKFTHYARQTIERTARVIRYAKRIEVRDGGTRLLCTDERNRTSAILYRDDDGNSRTLSNNRLYFVANVDGDPTNETMIGRFISPIRGKPIFRYLDRTSAVEINFRVGDPTNDPGASFQRETGPGPQGVDVTTAFGPRNSYLD